MNRSSARIGYARVSTADQNLDAQMAALEAAGCTMIRTETGDGASLAGRPELGTILEFIHPGETLVVTRIDRLARSMRDLQVIVATLKDKGRPSRCHRTARGLPRPLLARRSSTCSASLPSSRPNLRRERQAEGIAAAKQRGAYRGRPPQDRHGSHQVSAGHGPVADASRSRAGGLARNRLQGQGWQRMTKAAKGVRRWSVVFFAFLLLCRWNDMEDSELTPSKDVEPELEAWVQVIVRKAIPVLRVATNVTKVVRRLSSAGADTLEAMLEARTSRERLEKVRNERRRITELTDEQSDIGAKVGGRLLDEAVPNRLASL